MAFILAKQRDEDAVSAFRKYSEYLRDNEKLFPESAYALATSDWWFNFNDHRCPHDAWLEAATFSEPSIGERSEIRSLSLTLRLLGAYHDGHMELIYPTVYAYQLDMPSVAQGHGDWRYDELRVNEKGHLLHEIEWASVAYTGSWLIEASDLQYRWVPKNDA